MTDVVDRYVDAAIRQLRRLNSMRWPDPHMPAEMRDPSGDDNGWLGWRPISSTVSDTDLDELEQRNGMAYPTLYRHFLKTVHFYELSTYGVSFERHLIHRWRGDLVGLYAAFHPERIIGKGLIPFGHESFMDAGLVCFDSRSPQSAADLPVVIWDHDLVGKDREIQPLFSSTAKMFECLTIIAEADEPFFYYDCNEDEPKDLSRRLGWMRRFLATDPDGAGGPARSYWTAWGVNPDQ